MSLSLRLLLSAALATGLVGGTVPASQATTLHPLSSMVLQSNEVPAGFHRYEARMFTNVDEARIDNVSTSVIQKLGRITGYETGYSRATSTGMCCVVSQVSLWQSRGAARTAYYWHSAVGRKMYGSYPGFEQLSAWHGKLTVQAFPCSCPGGTEGILKLRTYKDSYYVFTQVNFNLRGADAQHVLDLAERYTRTVVTRVP